MQAARSNHELTSQRVLSRRRLVNTVGLSLTRRQLDVGSLKGSADKTENLGFVFENSANR